MVKLFLKLAAAIALFLLLNIVLSVVLLLAASFLSPQDASMPTDALALAEWMSAQPMFGRAALAVSSAMAIPSALIVYAAFERGKRWPLGWRQRSRFRLLLRGLGFGAGLITAAYLAAVVAGGVRPVGIAADIQWPLLLADAALFAVVGASEEIFSRGYVYGLVKRRLGVVGGVLASSLLFAWLHAQNPGALDSPLPMINLLLAGVWFALLREWSGGLWVPIGAHIAWNFCLGDVYGLPVSGLETARLLRSETEAGLWSGGAFGLEGGLATTLILAAASFRLIRSLQQRRNPLGPSYRQGGTL